MSSPAAPQFQPVHIGEAASPPLVVVPDPAQVFAARAMRLRVRAKDHPLAGYLAFVADICAAQAAVVDALPAADPAPEEAIARAAEYGMPVLRRDAAVDDPMLATTLDRLLEALAPLPMPEAARAALDGVIAADATERRRMMANVVADALPFDEVAEHVFVAAAAQVHFARLAAALPAARLGHVGEGGCPACGGPPVASLVVGWPGAHATRFVTCGCCATQWHVVRIKCVACSSTKGIHYSHSEGGPDTVKAECCDECRSYLKIFHQLQDPELDAVADDVASAGLDLMVKEQGYRRAGFNIFLAGF